jgi:hypothetical protein
VTSFQGSRFPVSRRWRAVTKRLAVVALFFVASPGAALAKPTPPLAQPNWTTVSQDRIDPQLAAGPNHVIITQWELVSFYDKSGNRITHVGNDASKPLLPATLQDVFKRLSDPAGPNNMQDNLNLPASTPCDRAHWDQRVLDGGKLNFCVDHYYDARALYDEFHDRFVIVASAMNTASKCSYADEAHFKARRNKLMVAYSRSSDPTDGQPWLVYYFDAVPGESCTDDQCRKAWNYKVGMDADYPVVGINRHTLMIGIVNGYGPTTVTSCSDPKADHYPFKTIALHVWNTDAMAKDSFTQATCRGACSWVYYDDDMKDGDGKQIEHMVWPAMTHGDAYLHDGWFAAHDPAATDKLLLWHYPIDGSKSKPALKRFRISVPAFDSYDYTKAYPQAKAPGDPTPDAVSMNGLCSLVQRGKKLFFADVGGKRFKGATDPDSAIRLAELTGNANGTKLTLGRNAIFGVKGEGYGSPALEVDANDSMVLLYRKIGVKKGAPASYLGFGARYLVWYAGDGSAPTGATLADNLGNRSSGGGDFDTAGISLAPKGRVYMMQPYVSAGGSWAYAVNFIDP